MIPSNYAYNTTACFFKRNTYDFLYNKQYNTALYVTGGKSYYNFEIGIFIVLLLSTYWLYTNKQVHSINLFAKH